MIRYFGQVITTQFRSQGKRFAQMQRKFMVLVAHRHARISELVDLRWDQIDFGRTTLAVRRVTKGSPATHPILGDELRAFRRLAREQEPKSPFVFTSERGSPFTINRLWAMTPALCKPTLAVGNIQQLCVTPSCHRMDLRTSRDDRPINTVRAPGPSRTSRCTGRASHR
jgi:integrase